MWFVGNKAIYDLHIYIYTYIILFWPLHIWYCGETYTKSHYISFLNTETSSFEDIHSHEIIKIMSPAHIWLHRSGLTLPKVMACCMTAPSHYPIQCLSSKVFCGIHLRAISQDTLMNFLCNVDVLVQERYNFIANALELRLSCTDPSTCVWSSTVKMITTSARVKWVNLSYVNWIYCSIRVLFLHLITIVGNGMENNQRHYCKG